MKIIVTGGAGFIGSAFIRLAISQGNTIINVDSLTYAACLSNLECVQDNNNYFFEHIDIRERSKLEKVFSKYKPDAVVHLAAESHVDRSIDGPSVFIESNIIGTFNLLETSLEYWKKSGYPKAFRFQHISTDEVFGSLPSNKDIKFSETSSYDPRSPYSASKASSDHLVRAWHETYQLPILITNCSNNYGPYQFPEKLIPLVIINALSGKELPIYGDGCNIRDWLYVEDHANALLSVLKNGENGRSYNIGGENECTNLEIVQMICSFLDELVPNSDYKYADLIVFVKDRPGHDSRYAIDPSRIRKELGWRPSVQIQEGLRKTIEWYLVNKQWWQELSARAGVGQRLGLKK